MKLIDESHPLYISTELIYLLDNYIKEENDKITIYVQNSFIKERIEERIELLQDYYYEKSITILVDSNLFETTPLPADSSGKRRGKLFGSLYLYKEYIDTPFFVGKSNSIAYDSLKNALQKDAHSIVFIYGETATGKTHVLQKVADRGINSLKKVYFNSANSFLDEIKASFANTQDKIIARMLNMDYFIIDDLQFFNKESLTFSFDIIHEIFKAMIEGSKKIMFSCDIHPDSLNVLPERIISRIKSGYVCKFSLPDDDIKRQYIDFFCKENNIILNDDIIKIITGRSKNIREVRGLLNYCELLVANGEINTDDFKAVLTKNIKENKEAIFQQTYNTLKEFYGLIEPSKRQKQQRRSNICASVDSIMYYLFTKDSDRLQKSRIRKTLNIKSAHHTYYFKKGEKEFSKLDPSIQKTIMDNLNREKEI